MHATAIRQFIEKGVQAQCYARWNGRSVAEALGDVSDDAVWRVMRKHDLHLNRRQSWCLSTDPEFSRKASEIVGLYLNPPDNAIVSRALGLLSPLHPMIVTAFIGVLAMRSGNTPD
jgi:hypothetical protein